MNPNDNSANPPAAEQRAASAEGAEQAPAKEKKTRAPRKTGVAPAPIEGQAAAASERTSALSMGKAAEGKKVGAAVLSVRAPSATELFAKPTGTSAPKARGRAKPAAADEGAPTQATGGFDTPGAPGTADVERVEAESPEAFHTVPDGAAAPKRRPRRAAASSEALAPEAAGSSPAVSSAVSSAALPASSPESSASSYAGSDANDSRVATPRRAHDAAAPADADADTGSESSRSANADESQAGEGKSGRRGRNRRRGRRGGDKARDAQGMPDPTRVQPAPQTAALAPASGEVFAMVLSGEYDIQPDDANTPEVGQDEPGAQRATESPAGSDVEHLDAPAADTDGVATAEDVEPRPDDQRAGQGAAAGPGKRVLAPEPDAPKLQKVLAQSGVGSRRDLEQMIADGRVTVNGAVAHTGQRISHGDRIQLDGKPVRYRVAPPPARVLAYHKPAGEVVTHDDPQQRPTVFRRLPRLQQGKWQSVGRLDINTEGLLLFTNSGELANQLMHPRFGVEREYAVRSLGLLSQESQAQLLDGVEIDGQRASFKSIEDGGGEGVNHWYRVVITEGRNREVRRLFEAVGHAVSRLIRIRYGSVVLPRGLKRGVWVDLQDEDLRQLRRLAGAPRGAGSGADAGRAAVGEPAQAAEGMGRNAAKKGRKRRGRRGGRDTEDLPPQAVQTSDAAVAVARPAMPQERGARPPRAERAERSERAARAERSPRIPRPPRGAAGGEPGEGGAIPNPLQQTFDKRAMQQARKGQREYGDDGPIPNPLLQTFDKRAMQDERRLRNELSDDSPIPNPLLQTYDKRFAQGGKGQDADEVADPDHIPDPMQTSVGYIGADALRRKGAGGRAGRGGRRTGSGSSGMGINQGGPRGQGGGQRGGPPGGAGNNKKRRGPRGAKGR